ncbi:MAG: aminopeptidase [Promethearchaeota archaeon]
MMADFELYTLKQMDAFIGIIAFMNISELSDLPRDKINNILKYYMQPVHLEQKNEYTRSVLLRWPTAAMAQRADMSTEAFEDFYFNACIIDYTKLEKMMEPIVVLMQKTDKVRIVGPVDTDISFSINGMPKNKNAGRHNIPDGEISTEPIRNSVEDRIKFNVPSNYYGTTFENICLDFKNGKVINAICSETDKFNRIINIDDGARYVGEFAFGLNPFITKPMKDIIFDEKIIGSIHLALGNAYNKCDNGNRSAIHWDLILMQTQGMGGGEIYFDGTLIRKDGKFVLEELEKLNFKNLNL